MPKQEAPRTRHSRTGIPGVHAGEHVNNEYLSWRRRRAARDVALSHGTLDEIAPAIADPSTRYDERDAMLRRIATLPRK